MDIEDFSSANIDKEEYNLLKTVLNSKLKYSS